MIFEPLKEIFAEYEKLSAEAELIFNRVRADFPQCVSCEETCSDCCHALFDLSLVEAMYLSRAFKDAFDYGKDRSDILAAADIADRQVYKFKRQINKEAMEGKDHAELLAKVGSERQRCPLLGGDDRCRLYAGRPVTCKLYGIPTTINGRSGTCGRSRFEAGNAYPSVNLDRIQDRLAELSHRIGPTVKSSFPELHMVYVPVSTALLTDYNESYLGIKTRKEPEASPDNMSQTGQMEEGAGQGKALRDAASTAGNNTGGRA